MLANLLRLDNTTRGIKNIKGLYYKGNKKHKNYIFRNRKVIKCPQHSTWEHEEEWSRITQMKIWDRGLEEGPESEKNS